MEAVTSVFVTAFNGIKTMGITDLLDVIIVAYLIYKVIWFVRRTNSYNLAKGVVLILIVLWLSYIFHLTMINFLLRRTVELGLIALVVLFQPELRRLLERMGRSFSSKRSVSSTEIEDAISQTVLACTQMSASHTGALLIFERKEKLNSIMTTGTIINSDISAELIKNLFYNKAPLHDGAVIMREGRIAAAGCVLPLTQSTNLSKELGMRHRAGIGLSEQSDAVVIIVSEETGDISLAVEGLLKRHLNGVTLDKLLRTELIRQEEESSTRVKLQKKILAFFRGDQNEKN
ncbi:MAG: diadenylate cyclase CdaA [Oscillospiraceae bacterium]|jgi:diadenylate cyclase|nr:diadenylate cyclase CdaA [Oscillospiraceae bacterium]